MKSYRWFFTLFYSFALQAASAHECPKLNFAPHVCTLKGKSIYCAQGPEWYVRNFWVTETKGSGGNLPENLEERDLLTAKSIQFSKHMDLQTKDDRTCLYDVVLSTDEPAQLVIMRVGN